MSRARDMASNKANNIQTVMQEFTTHYAVVGVQTYYIYGSVNLITRGSNSKFLMSSSINAYAGSGGRGNTGFSVTQSGVTTRLLGIDGGNGDSWRAFGITSGNTGWSHQSARNFLWTPSTSVPSGTTLTFNLLVAAYDNTSMIFNYNQQYGDKAHIIVTEIPGY